MFRLHIRYFNIRILPKLPRTSNVSYKNNNRKKRRTPDTRFLMIRVDWTNIDLFYKIIHEPVRPSDISDKYKEQIYKGKLVFCRVKQRKYIMIFIV